MNFNSSYINRLQNIFNLKFEDIKSELFGLETNNPKYKNNRIFTLKIEETWLGYLNDRGLDVISLNEVTCEFANLVNYSSGLKESVCVQDPFTQENFILIPLIIAERILVLGGLP